MVPLFVKDSSCTNAVAKAAWCYEMYIKSGEVDNPAEVALCAPMWGCPERRKKFPVRTRWHRKRGWVLRRCASGRGHSAELGGDFTQAPADSNNDGGGGGGGGVGPMRALHTTTIRAATER